MNLDRLVFVPRNRKKWEAADLGFRLVPMFWQSMLFSWFIVSLPVFLVFSLIEPLSYYATLVLWWLKPVFERTQLYVLSFGIFGSAPTWKETIKAFPKYAFQQIFPSLLWRRFSFTRSLDLPVLQLEKLRGEQRKKRLVILHQQTGNPASWLTIIMVNVEAILMVGAFLVVMMFIPHSIDLSWLNLLEDHIWLGNLIYYVCIFLVAPFYVASGFMLYINRRIELEGWDIELSFKEISRLHEKPVNFSAGTAKIHSIAFLFVSLFVLLFMPQNDLFAQPKFDENNVCSSDACIQFEAVKRAEHDILEVFEHQDFHQIETIQIPKWLDNWSFEKDEETKEESKLDIPPFLVNFLMYIASSIEVIIWVIAISIVVFLIFRYRSLLAQFVDFTKKGKPKSFEVPKTLFGLDVRQGQLPNDIEAECNKFIEKGDYRECLSLLYRATITNLLNQHRVPFNSSNTELECLAISQAHSSDRVYKYFSSVTLSWRKLAYGHIAPTRAIVEELCRDWNIVLDSANNKGGETSE